MEKLSTSNVCTNVAVLYVRDTTTYFFAQKNHKVLAKQKIILGLASITSLRMRIYLVCACTVVVFDMWHCSLLEADFYGGGNKG